jgi:CheY-like chemotaxis protein/anti-sigma regulatory factor (Ser/Thr protein kinase)
MSSGVVHDFNNILAAILGRIQIMAKKLDSFGDWSGRQFLEKNLDLIEKAANDGSHILSRISEFTKKKPSEKFVELQIDQIIADTIELTRPRWHDFAMSSGKEVSVEFHRAGILQTTGSPSELREVFTNLINNAVDAIAGVGRISMDARRDGDEIILITVEDNGAGMSAETRKKIFEPFFTTKGERGTGLGLSVTYGIINRHKGTIDVESELGRGTKFTIMIPVRRPGQDETRSIEIPAAQSHTGTVLVVDDEEQFRDIVAEILQSGGYEIHQASDGDTALQIISQGNIDVVITDLGMSGLSGWELADRIYFEHPEIKIIMATGWGANLEQETLQVHHVSGLICKPFRVNEILSAVERAIADKGNGALIEQV